MSAQDNLGPQWSREQEHGIRRQAEKQYYKENVPLRYRISDRVNNLLGQPTSHFDSLAYSAGAKAALAYRREVGDPVLKEIQERAARNGQ